VQFSRKTLNRETLNPDTSRVTAAVDVTFAVAWEAFCASFWKNIGRGNFLERSADRIDAGPDAVADAVRASAKESFNSELASVGTRTTVGGMIVAIGLVLWGLFQLEFLKTVCSLLKYPGNL
jgi:hypothetical protein